MTQHDLILLLYLTKLQLYRVISGYKPISSRENNDNCYRKKSYGVSCLSRTAARYRTSDICASLARGRRASIAAAGAHGAIKLYLLLYTTCTRVQTVSHNPYSCTGEMTPSIQVYTPDGSTRTAVQPASLHMYSCAAGAMCAAHLCSTHHSRCTAVRTVLPGLCAGSGLTFFNN